MFPRLLTLSSIHSRSTSSTKTHNTSFESSGRGQFKFRRKGAWQPQEVATTFFPKKYTFQKQWAWQASNYANTYSSGILMSIIRAFKWSIICFCTIIGSHSIWRKPKLMFKVYHSNQSSLYIQLKNNHQSRNQVFEQVFLMSLEIIIWILKVTLSQMTNILQKRQNKKRTLNF